MVATIKPMIEPDMELSTTFIGINHLQEKIKDQWIDGVRGVDITNYEKIKKNVKVGGNWVLVITYHSSIFSKVTACPNWENIKQGSNSVNTSYNNQQLGESKTQKKGAISFEKHIHDVNT